MRIGPIVWELDGPGPILKNSSIEVITGPFAFWTTASSAETFSGGALGEAISSFPPLASACLLSVLVSEQPARKAAAEASAAAREKPLRVVVGASFFGSDVEQVPQPEVLQVPQLLAADFIMRSWSAIRITILSTGIVAGIQ